MSRATRAFIAFAAVAVLGAKSLSAALDKPFLFVILALAGLLFYAALPSIIATVNSITGLQMGLSTPERLFRASAENDVQTVKRLLGEGASPNEPFNGFYAIGAAAEQGHIKIVDLLLHAGADPNLSSRKGVTPLMGACAKGDAEISKRLLDAGADLSVQDVIGISSLVIASGMGHLSCVRLLLERGADVNLSARSPMTPLIAACVQGDQFVARLLLESGADINAQAKDGATPLIAAAASDKAEMVSYLLSSGADRSVRTSDGKTALEVARDKGHDPVVQVLEKR